MLRKGGDYPDRLISEGLSRTQSIPVGETENVATATVPLAKGPGTQPKRGIGDLRYEHSDQPNEPTLDDLDEVTNAHKEVAKDIFNTSNQRLRVNGLQILKRYNDRHDKILTCPGIDNRSVLHTILEHMQRLVKHDKRLDLIRSVPPVAKEFLEYLLVKHRDLLSRPDDDGSRPLDMAAYKVKPVVFLVADLVLPKEKLEQLRVKCPAKSITRSADICSLYIPKNLRFAFAKKEKEMSSPSADACVHDTVNVEELVEWNTKLRETVSDALQPQSTESQRVPATILHTLLDDESFSKEDSSIKATSFQRVIELCTNTTLKSPDSCGFCPLHKAIRLYDSKGIDFGRLYEVIKSLVKQCPKSIYLDVPNPFPGQKGTIKPYALLKTMRPETNPDTGAFDSEKLESWLQTENLLKHTCIGSDLDQDEKMTYLYGSLKDAKDIYFDMAFPAVMDKDFVEDLYEIVKFQFDTILEYVSLRRDPDQNISKQLSPVVKDTPTKDRNPYQGVFEWLRSVFKVEKIFKVIIDDLVPYPHTDTAIIAAVKEFDIEIWDWRKLDLSSQTIFSAAETTRELYLHSSGNEAVLRSWGCKHGLALLPNLNSVTITMHPDLRETKKDCKRYFDDFKKSFCKWKINMEGKVHLNFVGSPTSHNNGYGDTVSSLGIHQSEEIAWVKAMRPFVDYLNEHIHNAEITEKADRAYVTIGLIDNGVNSAAKQHNIPKIAKGKSYYGERAKSLPFRDFFTGPSLHGTWMAACINEVCPMADLYVVRLDDSLPNDKFTVDSAIKAVTWATKMGVDIISMSWTFKDGDAAPEEREAFRTAIQQAHSNGIILFNSLNDAEMANWEDYWPLKLYHVIRIGSATKWGEKADHSKKTWSDYLFPGQEIPRRNLNSENETVSGSSLATAYAAGLAALIIYTARALPCLDPTLSQRDKEKLANSAKREGIEKAFRTLGGKPNVTKPQDLFVHPVKHFSNNPDSVAGEIGGTAGKAKVLNSFLTQLMLL